ncbi:MAG: fibronectin type III domain-containing protein [Clostridia bacterium]|nr:fibronectin type III domain-containing protein [Clostridia bacterium]
MTNQGAKTSSLNAGGSYTIPAGYHNGSGKVTANSLSSQTAGTATAAYILSGKTAWVGGTQITGTLAVQNISSVSASSLSNSSIRISWKNPAKGPYTGVKIFMSTSGNPGTGGTAKYTGTGSSKTASGTSYVDITGLTMGTTYYFTVCAYVTNVGNGTSYNVNAKTKGLVIYNTGTQYYTLSNNDSNNCTITFNSDNIQFTKKTLYGAPLIGIKTGNMDMSSFSKMCVNFKITHHYYAYVTMNVGYIANSGDTSYSTPSATKVVGTGSSTSFVSDITKITYTYGSLRLYMNSASGSDGYGSAGGLSGYIYKIWLE